jgi:hypothetical protein
MTPLLTHTLVAILAASFGFLIAAIMVVKGRG